jgi:hypothetical protein
LASSLRLHAASKEHPDFPSLEVFPEYLQPELDAGKVLIDSTRFVADEQFSRLHRGLPYATLRLCMVAAEYFRADYLLAAVRAEHQAFYRRAFDLRVILQTPTLPATGKAHQSNDGPFSERRRRIVSAISIFPFKPLRTAEAV